VSGFGVDHLPYGVFSTADGRRRVGARLDDGVLDLAALTDRPELSAPTLDPLLALGPEGWAAVRAEVVALAGAGAPTVPLAEVALHLPFTVGDYVDFYASEHHATNVGRLFRPDGDALLPNWKHLPVGYHGRAGSVVPSGTPVVRPRGQRGPGDFGPTRRLDLEAEVGFVVGVPSTLGTPVPHAAFTEHVFGVVIVNDWSARDLQAWEYVPLGPFLGKSFATTISHWVTPLAALDAAWCDLPGQDPRPLDYLAPDDARGLDLDLEVEVAGEVVSRPPYASTYWGPAQMLAHLTVNGASVRTGDLFASGTVSGPGPDQVGSLLELGATTGCGFLEDGEEVVIRASAPSTSGGRLSLGEVRGTVVPPRP
jgi:fumarylacetoacetase